MSTPSIGRAIVKEIVIAAPPERVYRAFAEQSELEHWFVKHADVGAAPGERYNLTWLPHQSSVGRIVEMSPPNRFVFAWDVTSERSTTCAFDFIAHDAGTLVRLTQTGFGDGDDWDRLYEDNSGGWDVELGNLKRWLDDGERKTEWFEEDC